MSFRFVRRHDVSKASFSDGKSLKRYLNFKPIVQAFGFEGERFVIHYV